MKHLTGWIFVLGLYALWVSSCQKNVICDHPNRGFTGEWIWTKSTGGIGGWTVTPESSNTTKRLSIDDFTYRMYENDSLIFESPYDLEIRPDSVWGTDRFIRFDNGMEWAVKIEADTLEVYELCVDCFAHTYRRQ